MTSGDTSNACASGSSPGTSAGERQRSGRAESQFSSAQSHAIVVSAPIPPADEESEPADQRSGLQTSAFQINEHVNEDLPVLSRVNPRRGPTSGGDEIVLVVSNLPPIIKLFARFGCNLVPTVSGMTALGYIECDHCAEVSLLGPYCTGAAFLSSPCRSVSWSGQCHTMSGTFRRCRALWEVFDFLRVRGRLYQSVRLQFLFFCSR